MKSISAFRQDMTPEAALAKLAYVLGRWRDVPTRKRMLSSDLRGEVTLLFPDEDKEVVRPTAVPMEAPSYTMRNAISDQMGIAQVVNFLGSICSHATEEGPANEWALRILPYLLCSAAEVNDCCMLQQIFDITHSFEVGVLECTYRQYLLSYSFIHSLKSNPYLM